VIATLGVAVALFTGLGSARCNTVPDHFPRERVVIDPPTACEGCGGNRLRKLGEDVTRILETQPRRWKAIETVREKFTCLDFGRRGDIDQRGP
jgi:transposase